MRFLNFSQAKLKLKLIMLRHLLVCSLEIKIGFVKKILFLCKRLLRLIKKIIFLLRIFCVFLFYSEAQDKNYIEIFSFYYVLPITKLAYIKFYYKINVNGIL